GVVLTVELAEFIPVPPPVHPPTAAIELPVTGVDPALDKLLVQQDAMPGAVTAMGTFENVPVFAPLHVYSTRWSPIGRFIAVVNVTVVGSPEQTLGAETPARPYGGQ